MPHLSSLVRKKKWNQVSEVLRRTSSFADAPIKCLCCYDCSERHNILHYILGFNPPVSLVCDLTETFPDAAHEMDCMLRYPLHVALMCGASADVISHLITVNKKALTATDKEGKTTLHLLFNDYKLRHKCNRPHFNEARKSFPEIIYILCHYDPKLILIEDSNEMNVLEYVIQEEVDYPTVKTLQRIAESAMKGKDLSWFRRPPPYIAKIDDGSASVSQFGKIMNKVRRTLTSRTA